MLIDEEFRKCVAFLVVDQKDTGLLQKKPVGTTFLVGVPLGEKTDAVVPYLVTTRHVIDASRPYGNLYVRLNMTTGGSQDFLVKQDEWTPHPLTDVAVIRIHLVPDADIIAVPLEMLLTDAGIKDREIGVGDEVFFVGLFSKYPGYERNQPIVRFGNVSLMPHEKIHVKLDPASNKPDSWVEAYLVEARSWGGHSGSPSFVYYPPDRKYGPLTVGTTRMDLLGVVHGHYEIEQDVAFIGDVLGSGKVPVNAGTAVVIPSQKIVDVLMEESLVVDREQLEEELTGRSSTPTPDSPFM